MKKINVRLEAEISNSFRAVRAANSVDLDTKKKAIHELSVEVDIETPYSIGLIVGASGSGKTTVAKTIFGPDCFHIHLDQTKSIIDQLPEKLNYEECAAILQGVGLTSIPCWIKPAGVLSNGQKARAEAALAMYSNDSICVLDEWTSVVDRSVAKVMSHCVQKFARRTSKKVVLVSCHYDVIEWLNPDWILDCNEQKFIDRRSLRLEDRQRREHLEFEVREIGGRSWKNFSKYHYLSDKLPAGKNYFFGLFHEGSLIGFICFANYIPTRKGNIPVYHSNRVVIHPDFAGLGLGIKLVNTTAAILKKRYGYEIRATFSSMPMYYLRIRDKLNWKLLKVDRRIGEYKNVGNGVSMRETGFRQNVKLFTFLYIGPSEVLDGTEKKSPSDTVPTIPENA
jgi:ABC-type Mn2+/Zn2+ transport system ATPase subunit/GNAT superfamily N-acetyltransferase